MKRKNGRGARKRSENSRRNAWRRFAITHCRLLAINLISCRHNSQEKPRLRQERKKQRKREKTCLFFVRPILIPSIQVPAGKFNTYWSSYPSAGSAFFKTLDSNLKKNTAFIKKVTKVGEETKEKLCAEMQTLNLSRYVSEVVAAIADAKLKNTDVGAVVQVCMALIPIVSLTPS